MGGCPTDIIEIFPATPPHCTNSSLAHFRIGLARWPRYRLRSECFRVLIHAVYSQTISNFVSSKLCGPILGERRNDSRDDRKRRRKAATRTATSILIISIQRRVSTPATEEKLIRVRHWHVRGLIERASKRGARAGVRKPLEGTIEAKVAREEKEEDDIVSGNGRHAARRCSINRHLHRRSRLNSYD